MHSYELADLAALAAIHGEQLIHADAATIDQSLSDYWKASRCRLDRWLRSLALLTKHHQSSEWTSNEVGAVEEILVSEILSRVVAAITVAHDERYGVNESAPVARNIFTAHLDVKRRAIALIVAPHRNAEQADDFLALRRQCDRWTDMLLAYLTPHVAVDEFAANPARVGDFAYDARGHLQAGISSEMVLTMIVAGMRSSLARLSVGRSPNADLNLEIATAVLAGFAPDFFDSHGHLRSTWLERIRRVPPDSPMNSDNWWHASRGDSPDARPARWRR
jgi:hypothetical protein